MTTSSADLVELVETATEAPAVSEFCETLQGALAFYCAGCSLQIQNQINEVAKNLSTSLRGQPFMGMLPYGEQGTDAGSDLAVYYETRAGGAALFAHPHPGTNDGWAAS